MGIRLDEVVKFFSVLLGIITLAAVAALFVWDISPELFPVRSHDVLAAFSLAMIAFAYLAYQMTRRPAPTECAKAILLAAAFLFWAANQLWANLPQAVLFNDVAIGLFILDVFFVIVGWPQASAGSSFAEAVKKPEQERRF